MPKDYKNVRKARDGTGWQTGNILSFIAGLTLGMVVSFIVYINLGGTLYKPFDSSVNKPGADETANAKDDATFVANEENTVQSPRFDFYNILPNKEINISEWVAEDQISQENSTSSQSSLYILQVGSFKQYEAADQVKAQLALIGVRADIQRVVINGQDTRHRVRIGPYNNQADFNRERNRLQENNFDFMVLKLKSDDANVTNPSAALTP